MTLPKDKSASFIIRIWREGGGSATEKVEWRGSIEQVQSGEKRYFQDLRFIQTFMTPFIEAMGIETPEHFWELMADPSMVPPVEELAVEDAVTKSGHVAAAKKSRNESSKS